MLSRVGIYRVKLCKNGFWQTITLDDNFPCYVHGGPIYSRNHDNELWVLLLEKAFAKSFGSYDSLRYGWCYEAMIDLTGAPFRTIRLLDEDILKDIASGALWSAIKNYDKSGYMLAAVTPGEDNVSESGEQDDSSAIRNLGSNGLVAGHAYTLLEVIQTKSGHQLVKLRNPWGRYVIDVISNTRLLFLFLSLLS
jgi:calpain-15